MKNLKEKPKMLNLSITPMDPEHIDETVEDLIDQSRRGISNCAMLMMKLSPEGTPPVNKAEIQCRLYDKYREKLDAAGVRHGVLVQSTLGHIYPPSVKHPFTHVQGLVTNTKYDIVRPYNKEQLVGNDFTPMCCPYDKEFQNHMREQMRTVALRRPSVIMIDDDMGIVYRIGIKGCACPLHMAELNRRAGTNMTREELVEHVFGDSEDDKKYTDVYLDVQGDSLEAIARAMREGIDSVDPSIQGAVSIAGNYCEFTERIASAFAGKGNPAVARYNNGNFGASSPRGFTKHMLRAATQREHLKGKIDIFLTESDTCPHNRYATAASVLHSHMTGTILEGAKGAKHWITTSSAGFNLATGRAYRNILAKYSGFYEELSKLYDELRPVGCRIPLSKKRDFCLRVPDIFSAQYTLSPWCTNVLERLGLPMYFSSDKGGAVFLDDDVCEKFTDEEITEFFKGTVFLSAKAARLLISHGMKELIGVDVREWNGRLITTEKIAVTGTVVRRQVENCELIPVSDDVEISSGNYFDPGDGKREYLCPGSTVYKNPIGGTAVVFSGTANVPFHYDKIVSYLNDSRKAQIADIMNRSGDLPVYYPEDIEMYLRAGYLKDGTLMCACFNLGLDSMEDLPLVINKPFTKIEKLLPSGERAECEYEIIDGVTYVKETVNTLMPIVLFIK